THIPWKGVHLFSLVVMESLPSPHADRPKGARSMKSNTTTILVAAGALLVGGVATAAFMNNRGKSDDIAPIGESRPALDNSLVEDPNAVAPGKGLEYADVVKVDPITQKEKVYAT